jgi:hypothetical protein
MTKRLLVVCALLQTGCLCAGTMQETFLKGNAAYVAGNCEEALKLYQLIEPKGPAVWYNMGNCYFRMNKFPEAIVQWSRAQKNASWRDFSMLETYIAQAYQVLGIVHEVSLLSRMQAVLVRCGAICSLIVLQLLFLCCLSIFCLLMPTLLRRSNYFFMISCIALMLCIGFVGIIKYRDQEYPWGIVTKNSISVYAGPGIDYAPLAEAKMLDKVRVYQKRDGWLKVHVDQSGYGWVQETDLAVIE